MLTLEITESAIISDPQRAAEVLRRLKDLGVRLSIDDFGTGYSSIAYLRTMPVHEMKIDRSFTTNMRTDAAVSPSLALSSVSHTASDQR